MGIVVTHGWNPAVTAVMQEEVDRYNSQQREVSFRVTLIKSEGHNYGKASKDALSLPPDRQPHAFAGPEFLGPELYQAIKDKKIIPIEELIDPSLVHKISAFVKKSFAGPDGAMHSMPINPACGVMFYNKTMMKQINENLHLPSEFLPKTIEDVEMISRGLIQQKIARGGYTLAWPTAYLVEIPAARSGRFIATPSNGKQGHGEYRFNEEWLVDHLMMRRAHMQEDIFIYPGQDKTSASKDIFLRGDVCFYMQGSSGIPH